VATTVATTVVIHITTAATSTPTAMTATII
jgi:hypothetical protein